LTIHNNKRYSDFVDRYNYDLMIIDESNTTAQALEKFYEDKFYVYYFSSIKSNQVYAIINENEKYLVKDLLNNNPTNYKITISRLEDAGLKFIKENKYEYVTLKVEDSYRHDINIINESIIEIECGEEISSMNISNPDKSYTEMKLFIIPLKSGNTDFEINLINNQDESEN
jgi:hypothetical protein